MTSSISKEKEFDKQRKRRETSKQANKQEIRVDGNHDDGLRTDVPVLRAWGKTRSIEEAENGESREWEEEIMRVQMRVKEARTTTLPCGDVRASPCPELTAI